MRRPNAKRPVAASALGPFYLLGVRLQRVDVSPNWREYLSVASAVVAVKRSVPVAKLST
jgi:hypothetical protein